MFMFLQWLKAVMRLQSDIARSLSLGEEPSALKPTASVTPQVKLGSAVDGQEKNQSDLVNDDASQCIPTRVNAADETSHSKVLSLNTQTKTNCELSANSINRRMPNGLRVNYKTVSEDVVGMSIDDSNCDRGINAAATLERFSTRLSDETTAERRRHSQPEDTRGSLQDSAGCSDWSSAKHMSTVQSDELAVAHVLSGIGQLAAVAAAAAAIPNVGNSNTMLSTHASLAEGDQFVSESGKC